MHSGSSHVSFDDGEFDDNFEEKPETILKLMKYGKCQHFASIVSMALSAKGSMMYLMIVIASNRSHAP